MFTIKTLNKIDERGLALFDRRYEINGEGEEDAILVRSAKMHDYVMPKSLLAIGRAGAGVNNIPVDQCAEKGVVVFNTPGANANAVKELVIAGILLSSRNIVGGIQWAQTLKGQEDVAKQVESGKGAFTGPEIEGKVLGVIGLGAIGVLVANAAASLGMEVYGYDPFISVDAAWGLSRAVHKAPSMEEVLAKADYVTVHVPLMEGTRKMINKESLGSMKDGVRILNFSRDALVDDEAMEEATASGKVSYYVTDFPNEKTIGMQNVIAIPHLGASTPESEVNCAIMAAQELKNYLEHGSIKNSVNYPDCEAGPCCSNHRVTLHHRNVPNMVSQIASVFAKHNINIEDMINKSRKDWAYTVLDVENDLNEEIVGELEAIEGVVRVRLIEECGR
ncbi:phosphoglycerate dehydrogenase [Anaerotalea alkaliphila]|uniref:D-3-phosphoglycerate dehydrogenase n=1 Tax=Anaerotalea alkaliphila TaxID=2662126 RepID=A0A7X5HUR4_9FIRM|nr:phosphoglycerate dehydrogenase [Anaerotalea alkaliphila]NDL66925.1 phosphoglycerate dehydrogenase [Anaerotalea alkaliphila]